MSVVHRQSVPARLKLPERATAIALLLLLHAALFYLINPKFAGPTETRPLNEITLSFNSPKPIEPAPPVINPVLAKPFVPAISPPVIPEANPPLSPALAAPNVTGIGRSLFNCDLANGKNLSREERANCPRLGIAPPAAGIMEAGMPKTSKARNSALWAAELEARHTPVRVPCTGIAQTVLGGPGVQKQVTAIMADPLCLLNGVLNGFHPQRK
ncbi:MAG TPA: hypothetical protein VKR31_10070 [Rhizomicrobium sp.]|nr:hypothetical protein [Rhizomicrobium sp.]